MCLQLQTTKSGFTARETYAKVSWPMEKGCWGRSRCNTVFL